MKKFSTIKMQKSKKSTTLKDCSDCPALCCHDLSILILKPSTKKEIDELKWHLNYDTVGVYIRNKRWYVVVKGRCSYLGNNNLCTIYDRRFENCRKHNPPYCERYDDWYDILFTTPEELGKYLEDEQRRWRKKQGSSSRSKKKS